MVTQPRHVWLTPNCYFQVLNQDGNPFEESGLVPNESVTPVTITEMGGTMLQNGPADGPIGPNPKRNSQNTGETDAKGQFVDAPIGTYGPNPIKTSTRTQKIYFNIGGEKTFVRTNKITVTGQDDKKNKQYVYTISNGSDIKATTKLPYK